MTERSSIDPLCEKFCPEQIVRHAGIVSLRARRVGAEMDYARILRGEPTSSDTGYEEDDIEFDELLHEIRDAETFPGSEEIDREIDFNKDGMCKLAETCNTPAFGTIAINGVDRQISVCTSRLLDDSSSEFGISSIRQAIVPKPPESKT